MLGVRGDAGRPRPDGFRAPGSAAALGGMHDTFRSHGVDLRLEARRDPDRPISSSPASASSPTSSSPGRRGSRSGAASSSTSASRPLARAPTRSATWPSSTTRSSGAIGESSTGRTPPTTGRPSATSSPARMRATTSSRRSSRRSSARASRRSATLTGHDSAALEGDFHGDSAVLRFRKGGHVSAAVLAGLDEAGEDDSRRRSEPAQQPWNSRYARREATCVGGTLPNSEIEQLSIDTIRTLSMDAVQQANAGHPGTAMALAPLAYLLYTEVMRHNPASPHWPNRDRFILSAGHACVLQYSALHLVRLQPLARGAETLPSVAVGDAGPPRVRPHRRRRGDHRATRPGVRQRRRHGLRRTFPRRHLQPASPRDRRPPRLRDLLGRRPDGGRVVRGRLAGRHERARASSSTSTTTTTSRSTGRPRSPSRRIARMRFEALGWHVQSSRT